MSTHVKFTLTHFNTHTQAKTDEKSCCDALFLMCDAQLLLRSPQVLIKKKKKKVCHDNKN